MIENMAGAIFDMDGTLADSLFLWDVLWEGLGRKYRNDPAFRPSEEDDKLYRTMLLKDVTDAVCKAYGMGESGQALLDDFNEILTRFYSEEVTLKEGALEFLEYCRNNGIPMCLASATQKNWVESALKHCGIYGHFACILSCAEVGKGKDEPDIFLLAAEKLGTDPKKTFVFEDSLTAIRTARTVGMKTVAIYDKNNYGQEEMKRIADVYVAEGETMKKLIPAT